MALRKFHCLNCDKEFDAGDWMCKSGEAHVVTSKRYYMTDAPFDKRDAKHSRTMICGVIPETKEMRGQDQVVVPGINVEFVRGMYETQDPHIQMRLDNRPGVLQGEEGKAAWEAAYLSKEERSEFEQNKLRTELDRLQADNNRLLAQIQEQKQRKSA